MAHAYEPCIDRVSMAVMEFPNISPNLLLLLSRFVSA